MLNFKDLKAGDKVVQAAHSSPGSCADLLRRVGRCGHEACWTPEQTYTVVSFRKAPNINLTNDTYTWGNGCAVRCDSDGNFPGGWSKK